MAKNSILSIAIQVVKQGSGDREVIKGLAQLKSNVTGVVGVLGAMAGAAYTVQKAYDATVGTFVDYAAQVRDLSRLSGASAEDSSRLIQAADDVKISYESLQKSLWHASKNGVEVNIDSLARLADEYNALASPVEQADFLATKFGKSGAEMAKLMEQGSSGVRELTASIGENLVLTEASVKAAREYEIQVDTLTDQWEAFKITLGQGVLPTVNKVLYGLTNTNAIREEANRLMEEGIAHNREEALSLATINLRMQERAQTLELASIKMREYGVSAQDAAVAQEDLEAATQAYNDQIKTLGEYMGGDLGQAQDDYNAKIADYKIQLEQARGEEEKRDIQSKIDAETEAYNRRAAAIMFNIQQQAIMAAVEQDPSKQQEAVAILGQMAEQYGLIDQAQRHAMVATASLTEQWMNGTISTEHFTTMLAANTKGVQANASAINNEASAIYHVAQRAKDTAGPFGEMQEAQSALADGINSESAPAVGNLKTQIRGLPPSGTSWVWTYSITGSGAFPRIPSRGNATGPGAGYLNNAGVDQEFAAGGQMQLGQGWALVGEKGPELVSPTGYVFTHEQSMALLAGANFSGGSFAFGGDMYGGGAFTPGPQSGGPGGSAKPKKRRDRGSPPPSGVDPSGTTATVATAANTPAVETLAASTEAAMQSAAAAQQQQVTEGIQTRNAINKGNQEIAGRLEDLVAQLHVMNSTLPRAIAAAANQSDP